MSVFFVSCGVCEQFATTSLAPACFSACLQDFDGLIGRFSGSEVPSSLSTDTGMLTIKFSSDGSLQVGVLGRALFVGVVASSGLQLMQIF